MTTPTHQQAAEGALTDEHAPLPKDVPYPPSLDNVTIYNPYGPMSMDPIDGQPVEFYYDRHGLRDYGARCIAWAFAQGQAAPVVPEGWMLVPAEATPEMMRRGMSELSFGAPIDSDMANAWYAMLAAVPAAPLPDVPAAHPAQPLSDGEIAAAWKAWPQQSITSAAKAIDFVRFIGITAQGGSADAPGSLYDLSDKGFVDINKGGGSKS